MKDMLNFLIARDTMHQQQWLAVLEELGPEMATNAPGDYVNGPDHREYAYTFFDHLADRSVPEDARWTSGPALDNTGAEYKLAHPAPALGQEPELQKAPPEVHAGVESTAPDGASGSAAARFTRGLGSVMDKVTPGD
jgi:Mn-containing catalase